MWSSHITEYGIWLNKSKHILKIKYNIIIINKKIKCCIIINLKNKNVISFVIYILTL